MCLFIPLSVATQTFSDFNYEYITVINNKQKQKITQLNNALLMKANLFGNTLD